MFGADRFYLGYPALGLIKFSTLGFFFLGQLIDVILIATQVIFVVRRPVPVYRLLRVNETSFLTNPTKPPCFRWSVRRMARVMSSTCMALVSIASKSTN